MVEIEKFPCNDSNEANARERYWYENLNSSLNSRFPQRNHLEYVDVHKEKIKKYKCEWRRLKKINASKEIGVSNCDVVS
jgi:hypothetical protein